MESNTLTLPLKKKWFDLIKSGAKIEEYREITSFWKSRFYKIKRYEKSKYGGIRWIKSINFKNFDKIIFTLGYPKKDDASRHLVFKNPRFRIGEGRPEWGAELGKKYFVITWDAE